MPRDWNEAVRLDEENGNQRWHKACNAEMNQLDEHPTFIDKGKFNKQRIPKGCEKITAHLIFDVKHDGRHKARMVAGGHLTNAPLESVHAGVVSLRGLRMYVSLQNSMDLHHVPPTQATRTLRLRQGRRCASRQDQNSKREKGIC